MSDTTTPAAPLRHTILLVDDDQRVRRNLALLLRWSGEWELVGEAADSEQALELATALHPEIVLIDRWLADGDSLRMLPKLSAIKPPLRVVLMTAAPDEATEARALALGASACFDKITQPLDLLNALRTIAMH